MVTSSTSPAEQFGAHTPLSEEAYIILQAQVGRKLSNNDVFVLETAVPECWRVLTKCSRQSLRVGICFRTCSAWSLKCVLLRRGLRKCILVSGWAIFQGCLLSGAGDVIKQQTLAYASIVAWNGSCCNSSEHSFNLFGIALFFDLVREGHLETKVIPPMPSAVI